MNVSDDKKAEMLNDHYKDTFAHLVAYRKQRDRLTFIVVGLLGVMMLELMSFPNESTIFFSIVSTKLGNIKSSALNYHVEIVILLIVVVILFRRFVQVGKLIDAQYPYVLELERKLACFYKSDLCFAREKKYSWQGDGFLSIWGQLHLLTNDINSFGRSMCGTSADQIKVRRSQLDADLPFGSVRCYSNLFQSYSYFCMDKIKAKPHKVG